MSENRARLTLLTRRHRQAAPTVSPQMNLLPREVVESNPIVLEAFDRFVNAKTARTKAHTESRKLRDKATQGRADYQRQAKDAITTGADTSKLADPHDKLIAQAEAHDAIATNAVGQLLRLGNELGEAIAEHAPELYAVSETAMQSAAERVVADIASLNDSWKAWAVAWQTRMILTNAHLYGGLLGSYEPNPGLPADVNAALNTITTRLADLDTLHAEESELAGWREEQRRAEAHNAGSVSR
jgi:hypothetical protein